ncbi:uracil-DNA glycosylase [Lactiplantibacillus mudanjiangensis]|uniref:Uracil-DNA glycosylase [Lactobacillus paracollinoides] n=1 Tax=Lactiplantibacillus mudanjiangensis TaxID=1296538 RepID=A0A660E2F5_9LACO|nr:uracil-DNA glycosylase [Lactiplantibacillus mudanjiangensis]VDG23580.1 uracil-DNA glycosylase [Lactobacillus paracollinoides] [Lactiplantibacillus mudanjiangensis]VDG28811.1 uracil-DNA glycosylase [Lactobacillus paracollinoides] [Lactiplantibacillus mudanjiangensis]
MATLLTTTQQALGRDLLTQFPQLEGFVPGEGSLEPKLVMVSEAPGAVEARVGHPFQGPAGTILDQWLTQLGLIRDEIYLTGAVRSRPYQLGPTGLKRDRKPTPAEIAASAPLLDVELSQLVDRLLVPLGNTGLQRLLGPKTKISAVHGRLLTQPIRRWSSDHQRFEWTEEDYRIWPLYHPSYSRRFKKIRPIVATDLAELKAYLDSSD